jgi:hypothetical protein
MKNNQELKKVMKDNEKLISIAKEIEVENILVDFFYGIMNTEININQSRTIIKKNVVVFTKQTPILLMNEQSIYEFVSIPQ